MLVLLLIDSVIFFKYKKTHLTLNPLTWKIWCALTNASRWQMRFNSAFKGLMNRKDDPVKITLIFF